MHYAGAAPLFSTSTFLTQVLMQFVPTLDTIGCTELVPMSSIPCLTKTNSTDTQTIQMLEALSRTLVSLMQPYTPQSVRFREQTNTFSFRFQFIIRCREAAAPVQFYEHLILQISTTQLSGGIFHSICS